MTTRGSGFLWRVAEGLLCHSRLKAPAVCKVLVEPPARTVSARGRLDTLRAYAHTMGISWPYLRLDGLGSSSHVGPGLLLEVEVAAPIFLHFAILVPDYVPELVNIQARLPLGVTEVLQLVQAQRDPHMASLFPVLFPALPQTRPAWGLLLALPDWGVTAIVIIFDLLAVDGRLFATTAPGRASVATLLVLACVPPGTDYHVYTGFEGTPRAHDQTLTLLRGQCITIVPVELTPGPANTLCNMLRDARAWPDAEALPFSLLAACYGLVMQEDCYFLSVDADRPWRFRRDIARECAVLERTLRIFPAQPVVGDYAYKGVRCRNVIAVSSDGADTVPLPQAYALADCRPLLQGFRTFAFWDNTVSLRPLEQIFQSLLPPTTRVSFAGHWPVGGHKRVQPGEVLEFIGARASQHDWPLPALGPTEPYEDDLPNPPPTPKRGRSQIKALQLSFGGKMMGICAFLLAWVPSQGTAVGHLCHQTHEELEPRLPAATAFAPRPVPTPLRNLLQDIDRRDGHQQEEASKVKNLQREVSALGPPQTLLQEALEHPRCEAMFLARTLLETLVEHLGSFGARALSRPRRSDRSRAAPITLSLTDSLEVTPYQRKCLALSAILPHDKDCSPPSAPDWLDTHIRHVLANKCIDIRLRTAFVNFKNWHEHTGLQAHRVLVYTDGSASASPDDLRPAAWAFAVFVRSSGHDYFYGQAAAVAMPPSSPVHIGEQQDDALTGELLALCWSLSWIAEFGPHFRAPVELLYDSQSAGGGTFGVSSPVTGKADRPYEHLANLAVSLRHYASALVTLEHDYIPSHSGALGNELADALAKTARSLSKSWDDWLLPSWLPLFAKHSMRDWAWAFVQSQVDVPRPYAFEAETSLARRLPLGPIPAPPTRLQTRELPAAEASFDITFISFNALTLKEPDKKGKRPAEVGMRVLGRKAVLKGSLDKFQPHVIGLQETRLDNSEFQRDPDYFICNAESDDMGVGGCSLWFSRKRPYGVCAGQPLLFQESDITVVSLSHRHLSVNLLTARLRLHKLFTPCLSPPMESKLFAPSGLPVQMRFIIAHQAQTMCFSAMQIPE